MQRTVTPVKMVIVEWKCSQCSNGMMCSDSSAYLAHPAQYPHICKFCGHKELLEERFPYMSYRLNSEEGHEIYRQAYEYG